MNLEKLLEYLEIGSPDEFEYFENLADLVEAEAEMLPETIYQLFEQVDMEILGELLNNYFEELLKAVPEDALPLYTLLDSIKMALVGISRNIEEENDLVLLSDEFCRFRNWYSLDSTVWVQEIGESSKREKGMPLRDALTLARIEMLGGEKYEYIFDEVMGYEIDQYTMSFADLMNENEGGDEDEDADRDPELKDLQDPELEYTDHIFTPGNLH